MPKSFPGGISLSPVATEEAYRNLHENSTSNVMWYADFLSSSLRPDKQEKEWKGLNLQYPCYFHISKMNTVETVSEDTAGGLN